MADLKSLIIGAQEYNEYQNPPHMKDKVSRLRTLDRRSGKYYVIFYLETILINVSSS